ncbi:MAG: hypothetical protein AAF485_15270 [Chloroflexota bacterium]
MPIDLAVIKAIVSSSKMIGQSLACFAPRDFEGRAEGYAKAPDNGATFLPDIRQLDDT